MSSGEILTLVGLLLALVAAAVALWQGYLLRQQIEYSREVNQLELYFRVASQMKDLDVFFVDRPDMRPYFYENKPLPRNSRKQYRMEAAAEMLCDLTESVIACGPGLGSMAVDWNQYFAFLYQNSAALRAYWAKYSYYYPDSVREAFGASVQTMPPSRCDVVSAADATLQSKSLRAARVSLLPIAANSGTVGQVLSRVEDRRSRCRRRS